MADDATSGVLVLCGSLDLRAVAGVRERVHRALDEGAGDLVLDMAQVDVVDAAGLGVLVGAHRRAQRLGRRLVLRRVGPRLSRQLLATRLHRVLNLETTIDLDAVLLPV